MLNVIYTTPVFRPAVRPDAGGAGHGLCVPGVQPQGRNRHTTAYSVYIQHNEKWFDLIDASSHLEHFYFIQFDV